MHRCHSIEEISLQNTINSYFQFSFGVSEISGDFETQNFFF